MNPAIIRVRPLVLAAAIVGFLSLVGCSTTNEARQDTPAPWDTIGTVAILEFENLTDQPNASQAVTSILRAEMQGRGISLVPESTVSALAARKIDVVELARKNQFDTIAATVKADHLLVGRVTEYHYRHGLTEQSVVGFTIQAISLKSGKPVWAATYADRGAASFTGGESLTEVTRRICRQVAGHLATAK